MTLFYTDASALDHRTPPGHPERAERMTAIYDALRHPDFGGLKRRTMAAAPADEVLRCHHPALVAALTEPVPQDQWAQVDGDTFLSPGSLTAALTAVGGVEAAIDAVLAGEDRSAFLAMRPPGHHAERNRSMGFCLFSTVAIGAKYALDAHGLKRIAVLDFDVHHGNGTQNCLWDDSRVLFVSSHQMPLYPGTGAADETGAHGQIVNLPLPPGSDGQTMRRTWARALPRIADFAPDIVLVSAGFDAHHADPLGGLEWTEADYAWITHAIADVADDCSAGRVVSALEGGYDLGALAASVATHLRVLMERGE
jgi:acetoin utilization deacetylase AcuC-like enzyme